MIIGSPDVYPYYGDINNAWTPSIVGQAEFIEFAVTTAVCPTSVDVFETYNAGSVIGIFAKNPNTGQWDQLYAGSPSLIQTQRIFSPSLQRVKYNTNIFRLNLDCSLASSYCELDAVRINGSVLIGIPIETEMGVTPNTLKLFDNDTTTCVSGVRRAAMRLVRTPLNTSFDLVMTGRGGIQCINDPQLQGYLVFLVYKTVTTGIPPLQSVAQEFQRCNLTAIASQQCRYRCVCPNNLCDTLVLQYRGCTQIQADVCEIGLE